MVIFHSYVKLPEGTSMILSMPLCCSCHAMPDAQINRTAAWQHVLTSSLWDPEHHWLGWRAYRRSRKNIPMFTRNGWYKHIHHIQAMQNWRLLIGFARFYDALKMLMEWKSVRQQWPPATRGMQQDLYVVQHLLPPSCREMSRRIFGDDLDGSKFTP